MDRIKESLRKLVRRDSLILSIRFCFNPVNPVNPVHFLSLILRRGCSGLGGALAPLPHLLGDAHLAFENAARGANQRCAAQLQLAVGEIGVEVDGDLS